MIEKTKVKNFYGRIIGYIETDTVTGNKIGRNFYNKIIGRYNKAEDKTRDFYNHVISRGDTLTGLILAEENKK